MRRFGFYIVVGLFASLLWAGSNQSVALAAPLEAAVATPTTNFAELVEWAEIQCEPNEPAIDVNISVTDPQFDINGSAIVTEYVICPIVEGMYIGIGLIVNLLEESGLLKIPPLISTEPGQGAIFTLWGVMRDFANVGLVIGLFLVIFSQATSYGLSAYGVKKMLPKVVIAALLVNLSYITCAVLVDVFNILGATLDDLLLGTVNDALAASGNTIQDIISTGSESVSTGIAVGGGVFVLVMAFMLIVIFFILLLFGLVAVLFLVARQVLVVCLIVAAPLAFIAWLFPNTAGSFRKWWSTLIKLLAIYPIVMCLKAVSYVVVIVLFALLQTVGGA